MWAQWPWSMGLVALWHVESSQTRDQTSVPCIARWILNRKTTREAWLRVLNMGSAARFQEVQKPLKSLARSVGPWVFTFLGRGVTT